MVSMAAGVLMTTAFSHLLPEAIELSGISVGWFGSPFFFALVGFVTLYIFEQAIVIHTCAEDNCAAHSFGIVASLGIGLHSLLDGIVIGIGFEVSTEVGLITSLAVLLHEIPEGIFTMSILLNSSMKLKKAVIYTIVVALATPIGAWMSLIFIKRISPLILGNMLAFAAGTFIYIAASDLIPQTHKVSRKANVPLVIMGGVFIFLISKLL